MHNALLAAEKYGMTTVQVFTKNQKQWHAKPLDPATIKNFRTHADRLGFANMVSHASYLINLGTANDELWEKSIAAFADEMRRCDQLNIRNLVIHPGAHVGAGEEAGIARVVTALNRLINDPANGRVTICLETTAGQGSSLGCRFEHLAAMIAGTTQKDRIGICVDTCHILAAGYDVRTADSTRAVLAELDRIIGIERVKAWHLNDSKKPFASRVDRHDHIGRGHVGLAAFGVICSDPRFAQVPKILETPKDQAPNGRDWDELNLELLEKFAAGKNPKLHTFQKTKPKAAAPRRWGTRK